MTRERRRTLIALGAVALLLLFLLTRGGGGVEVETAVARRDTLREVVTEEGRTRLRDRYVIASPVTGRLARIEAEEGEPVAAGEVVARVSPAPEDPRSLGIARARLSAAEARAREAAAGVEEARGLHEQAEREAGRRRGLHEAGALSREALEKAELEAASARRRLEAARAALAAAEADVRAGRAALTGAAPGGSAGAAVEVRAPSPGRVLRVLEESERVVQAGTPLLEVGDAGGLEVVVDVLSEDAVRIAPGDPVRIEGWGGERALHGTVRLVEPAAFTEVSALGVEEQRVNVVADLADAPPSLGAGYRVEAGIVTWTGEDVLTVPTGALFQGEEGWRLFVVEDGRAALREVELGHRNAEAAEVTSGLAEGEVVILFPSDLVEAGARVSPAAGG